MEPRSIACPHCKKSLKVTEDLMGKTVSCAACGKKINLVAGSTPPKPAEKPKPEKASGVPKPPPVPSSAHPWQLHVHGRNVGPFGPDTVRDQLRAGKISLDTLAWKEGMDDWTPLGEIPELCEAPTTPAARPKARAKGRTKPKEKDKAQGKEHHHRYVPGRGNKDVVMGTWIAIGMGVILLIAILVIMNQDEEEPVVEKKKPKPGPQIIINKIKRKPKKTSSAAPKTTTPDGKRLPRAARLSREKLLGEVKTGIDEWFQKGIEAHKIGDPKPIGRLAFNCEKWAADLTLGEREWGPYQNKVDRLVELLGQAGAGIKDTLKERATGWHLGDGLSAEKRAEILELNKYQWLESWRDNLGAALKDVRDQGIEF